jgi:hypothetical protein
MGRLLSCQYHSAASLPYPFDPGAHYLASKDPPEAKRHAPRTLLANELLPHFSNPICSAHPIYSAHPIRPPSCPCSFGSHRW